MSLWKKSCSCDECCAWDVGCTNIVSKIWRARYFHDYKFILIRLNPFLWFVAIWIFFPREIWNNFFNRVREHSDSAIQAISEHLGRPATFSFVVVAHAFLCCETIWKYIYKTSHKKPSTDIKFRKFWILASFYGCRILQILRLKSLVSSASKTWASISNLVI